MDYSFDRFDKTPANFRALRDMVGFKQDEFADIVGVDRSAVRRWDSGKEAILTRAWTTLQAMVDEHFALVADLMGDAADAGATEFAEGERPTVELPYYRSADSYRGSADWMSANKAAHAAAERLLQLGYRVSFVYPA